MLHVLYAHLPDRQCAEGAAAPSLKPQALHCHQTDGGLCSAFVFDFLFRLLALCSSNLQGKSHVEQQILPLPRQGTLLHFQWTGSDANNNGNAGTCGFQASGSFLRFYFAGNEDLDARLLVGKGYGMHRAGLHVLWPAFVNRFEPGRVEDFRQLTISSNIFEGPLPGPENPVDVTGFKNPRSRMISKTMLYQSMCPQQHGGTLSSCTPWC